MPEALGSTAGAVEIVKALRLEIRRKAYDSGLTALENVRLELESGEFVALVGPSGAGKTTLLNILSGLDREFDGAVSADGRSLHRNGAPGPRVAYIFQEPRLMPWLTVLENVRLVLGGSECDRARSSLRRVGLDEFADAYPAQLSGGMQRRVSLARAFAVAPELLLMDEPFVSLDAPTANRLRRQAVELWQDSRPTVLFVTHDLREALALADRVVFLSPRPGKVLFEHRIELPRPREPEDPDVTAVRTALLAAHPEILSGELGDSPLAETV